MFRHPVSRLFRHFLPANFLNSRTRINTNICIRPFTLTRSTRGTGPPLLRSHCGKPDGVPPALALVGPGPITEPASATITDPQILVALGALTTNCPEVNNDCRPSRPRPGQNSVDDSFENHTASLLDGLATVCVHKPETQVLALGIQIDNIGGRIRLTIAGNHKVSEKSLQNLEVVWKILRDISFHHVERACSEESGKKKKRRRRRRRSTEQNYESKGEPDLLRRLQHTIYQFTSKVLLSRFDLHRLGFTKLATALKKTTHKPNPVGEHRAAAEILIGVSNVIENTLVPLLQKLKPNNDLEESEWRTLCIMMDGVLHDCENILDRDDERFCEKLVIMARDVDKTIAEGFPLRSYLEKITLLQSHIRALVRSAQSLRSTFVKKLSIHPIPAERSKLLIPETPEKLEAFVASVAHQQGYAVANTTFIRKAEHHPSTELKVHCECLIVKHFHTLKNVPELDLSSWNNISPFSYIGVSKLSCQACGSWLKAYRSLGQQSFVTKGIHQKWSQSWGMPQLVNREEMKQVQKDMARDTAKKFCLYQERKGRMVPLHNRTGTPLVQDKNYPLGNEEAAHYAAAKIKTRAMRD